MPIDVQHSVNNKMRVKTVIQSLISGLLLATFAVNVPQTIATPAPVGDSLEDGTRYLLYTSRNPQTPQHIEPEVESLVRSYFYALEPIVVTIPQWQQNSSSQLITALLQREKCNVFAVDLTGVDSESQLVESVSNLLILLHQNFAVPLRRLQLLGFAEGAHLAGAAAEQVQQQLGQKLPQITALDPTKHSEKLKHQLSSDDAQYVEVLHTSELGTLEQLGHVDYYPNGGAQQPGCDTANCSQQRAIDLAIEMWSNANDFVVAKCASVLDMSGNNCRWSSHRMGVDVASLAGIYFLETRSQAPFGRGAYHIGFL